jgi:hypothetical protein
MNPVIALRIVKAVGIAIDVYLLWNGKRPTGAGVGHEEAAMVISKGVKSVRNI